MARARGLQGGVTVIVLIESERVLGKMISSNQAEVTFRVADRARLRFGELTLTDEECTRPRSALRYFLSSRAGIEALRKLESDQ